MPEHDEEGGAPSHLSRKSTLVKSRVGCVMKSTYDLPESNDHVYGIKNDKKEEGVGPLITSWHTSNPSSGKESSKLIVFSNIFINISFLDYVNSSVDSTLQLQT